MYKLGLPGNQSVDMAVDRRRSAEATRKARIFNTRLRVMGIDHDALNQQVQEKKRQQNLEMQRDKAFAKLTQYRDNVLLQQDIDEREKRVALHCGLTQYWATHQRVEDSSDADLKCGLKGALEITIPGAELGPASMQIFQGEDVRAEQRRKEQMKKSERDLRAQKDDSERKRMGDKHREMLVGREMMHQDLMGVQLHTLEEESKKANRITLDNYNLALATEQAEKLKEQRRREERENLAEVWHAMTSDMMTERAEAAVQEVEGGGPPRVLVDKWKGMSPQQLSAIYRERERQRLERQRQREAEKVQEAAWGVQLLTQSRQAEEDQRREAELRREKRIQTDHDNMQLAREQQAHQEYLNKKLYTNKPTRDYFNQFNTSSR